MKLLEKIGSGVMTKVGLATALMGGGWSAGCEPVAVRGYGAPRPFYGPVYVAPRYGCLLLPAAHALLGCAVWLLAVPLG